MSFFRPEVSRLARRWAETAIIGAVAAMFLWTAWTGAALRPVAITVVLGALGCVAGTLTWIAAQKARLRRDGDDPGVVTVEEARITYFGPTYGGVIHLPDVTRISVAPSPRGAVWRIEQPDVPTLAIPAAAEGADSLPEAFAALPGFWIGRAAQAFAAAEAYESVIWRRS